MVLFEIFGEIHEYSIHPEAARRQEALDCRFNRGFMLLELGWA